MPSGSVTPAGGGPAAGSYLPSGSQSGVTLDTTTHNDPVRGSGKLATLIYATRGASLAVAQSGDAFPRWLFTSDAEDGFYMGDGTFDPYATGANISWSGSAHVTSGAALNGKLQISAGSGSADAARLSQVSPVPAIQAGALPTVQLVSATGAQILTVRDAETVTPCTFNPGAATTATVTVALSSDNVTYSTLGLETEPAGVAFDGTIHLVKVRVPAGWYLKLTANAQAVIGLTTYY